MGQWPYNHFYTICYIISHLVPVLVKSSIAYCKISHSSLSVTGHLLTDSCQCSAHFVNLIASMLSPASLFVPIQICCTTKISSNINGEHGGVCILSLTREISGSPLVHQFFSHCTVGPQYTPGGLRCYIIRCVLTRDLWTAA